MVGFANLLEVLPAARRRATWSSPRARACTAPTRKLPFSEADSVDHPVSLYAATKKSNELMAHAYSHLYGLPATGLRFFTVYGPWGRPDMSPMLFAQAIMRRQADPGVQPRRHAARLHLHRRHRRRHDARARRAARRRLRDLQHRQPHAGRARRLHRDAGTRAGQEGEAGAEADAARRREGDLRRHARAREAVGFAPSTPLAAGLQRFAAWFKEYYRS